MPRAGLGLTQGIEAGDDVTTWFHVTTYSLYKNSR